jgi:hypothetical protein
MTTPRSAWDLEASFAAPQDDSSVSPARLAHERLALTLLVCAAVLFARRPDMLFNPQFWAEDGRFYLQARLKGLHTLTETYAGYPIQLIVLWLLLAATADHRRWMSLTVWGVVLWTLALNVPRLREPALEDRHWADYAARIRAGEAVDVPINPGPQWTLRFHARTK